VRPCSAVCAGPQTGMHCPGLCRWAPARLPSACERGVSAAPRPQYARGVHALAGAAASAAAAPRLQEALGQTQAEGRPEPEREPDGTAGPLLPRDRPERCQGTAAHPKCRRMRRCLCAGLEAGTSCVCRPSVYADVHFWGVQPEQLELVDSCVVLRAACCERPGVLIHCLCSGAGPATRRSACRRRWSRAGQPSTPASGTTRLCSWTSRTAGPPPTYAASCAASCA